MKKFIKLLLSPIIVVIASCSLSKPSFCFSNDPLKVYLQKNGDIFGKSLEDLTSYPALGRNSTAKDIKRIIDSGNQCLVFLYSNTCSHCKDFLPIMKELVFDSKLELNLIETSNHVSEIAELKKFFPEGNYSSIFSDIVTPSMFLLRSPLTAEQIELTDIKSGTALENRIASLANITNISSCYSFEGFRNSLSDHSGLLYVLNTENTESNSFYDINIAPKAKVSSKYTTILNWQKLSQLDKENFKTALNLKDDFEVVLEYNSNGSVISKYSYVSDTQNAIDFISSYF